MRGDWLCGREESGMREGLALWEGRERDEGGLALREGRERDEGGTGSVGGTRAG